MKDEQKKKGQELALTVSQDPRTKSAAVYLGVSPTLVLITSAKVLLMVLILILILKPRLFFQKSYLGCINKMSYSIKLLSWASIFFTKLHWTMKVMAGEVSWTIKAIWSSNWDSIATIGVKPIKWFSTTV